MRRSSRRGTQWCLAIGLVVAALMLTGPAAADDYVGTPPPNAGSVDSGGTGSGPVAAQSGNVAQVAHNRDHRSGGLALTGTDVLSLLFVAAALVGTGILLKRRADRPVN